MKQKYPIIITTITLAVGLLSGCVQTSLTDDLEGKIDRSRTVEYVVIKPEQKDEVLYVLSGKELESEEVEDKEKSDTENKEELKEEKPKSPEENEKPPHEEIETPTQQGPPEEETRNIVPSTESQAPAEDPDTDDVQIGEEPGAAVLPEDDGE